MIDDPQKICEAFNIHFATIGEKIGKNIKSHDPTLLFPNSSTSFFCFPATPEEIYLLIGGIKTKKAIRENDISNNLLKLSNTVISPFLICLQIIVRFLFFLKPVKFLKNLYLTESMIISKSII